MDHLKSKPVSGLQTLQTIPYDVYRTVDFYLFYV